MIKNYFKIAFRNIFRNKLNSAINLIGLSLGLAACILITMYVTHEKSYDQFHEDANRIYSVGGYFTIGVTNIRTSRYSDAVGPQLKAGSPSVEATFRYYKPAEPSIIKTNASSREIFVEPNLIATDANLFSFFSFDLIRGNTANVLEDPFSVVLPQQTAEKYFGDANPIGKQLVIKQDSTYNFTVTGVMKDMPTNSSIESNIIISMASLVSMKETKEFVNSELFQSGAFATYLKLNDVSKVADIEAMALQLDRQTYEESTTIYELLPFTDTHARNSNTGRFNYLGVFPVIAILILILALTNYISLTTARASTRTKEVGVRKISGANRKSLTLQFYIESAIFVVMAFIIGILMSVLLKNDFLNILEIEIDNAFFLNPYFLIALFGLLLFAIAVSGIYPAMVLSAFKPIENFKNKFQKNKGGSALRKTFTTLQFTIAILLIICSIIMGAQLRYIRDKDTGLDRNNIVMIPLDKTIENNFGAFRNEVSKIPGIESTTVSQTAVYAGYNIYFVSKEGSQNDYDLPTFSVDENFMNTLGVSWYLKPKERTALIDNGKVIINKKTITEFGLQPDPRGQKLSIGNQFIEIAGVVEDFNYQSLENPIKPLAFFMTTETASNQYIKQVGSVCLYLKYKEDISLSHLLNQIQNTYSNFDDTTPFKYEFMDDTFDALYKSEAQLFNLFYIFVVLALIIAGLGLLGLVTFASQQRVKEIGVRKVLGAKVSEIVVLLSKDFMKLVILAIVIASPIAWYFADQWLQNFSFRIDIPWWSFVIAGGIAIILSLITLSSQGIKAATANPIKSLRTE